MTGVGSSRGAAECDALLRILRDLLPVPWPAVFPPAGMVPIHSGEVAEDLARYLADSEQTQSALGLGVSISKDCSVRAAGGFLVSVRWQGGRVRE